MVFKKKTKVEVQERTEDLKAEQRRWAARLTSLQVRTIRGDAAPRPSQTASVRQKLQELASIYMLYLDEPRRLPPHETPLLARSWVGGLQSYVAIQDRAAAVMRTRGASSGSEDSAAEQEREILVRILKVCDGIILGFHQMASAVPDAPDARALHAGLPVPDPARAIGAERGPVTQQAFAAQFSAGGLRVATELEDWQRHWKHNFTWNNEVLQGPADSAVWVPMELRPKEYRDRRNLPPLELDTASKALLDLAFDLGVDEVAMQTTLTLSGDITNHISPHLPPEERALLLEMHKRSVENGLSYWTSLIEAVTAFLSNLLGLIFQSKDKSAP